MCAYTRHVDAMTNQKRKEDKTGKHLRICALEKQMEELLKMAGTVNTSAGETQKAAGKAALLGLDPEIACPHCGHAETEKLSEFGATACKACAPGTHQNDNGTTYCLSCDAGSTC